MAGQTGPAGPKAEVGIEVGISFGLLSNPVSPARERSKNVLQGWLIVWTEDPMG